MFKKKSAAKRRVKLSDGRMVPLEDLIKSYERLFRDYEGLFRDYEGLLKATATTKELKVGEWFRIDRNVIDNNRDEIYRKCMEEGTKGQKLWERFEESNKIAEKNTFQYTRVMEVYIFPFKSMRWVTEEEMRDLCELIGDGMCDEIICDFELQMRICNGESVHDLVERFDKLPSGRIIKLRDGGTGFFGSGDFEKFCAPPSELIRGNFNPKSAYGGKYVPYAFRRVRFYD